jgi:hypothetical protein
MIELISQTAKNKIEESINNTKEAIKIAEENALSSQKLAEKMQVAAKEAIVKAEELSKMSQAAANEAIKASKEAAEASQKAAEEAGQWWVKVFTELLSDTGQSSERAKQIVKQTSDFMQKTPQEIVIESSVNKKKHLKSSLKSTESDIDDTEKTGDEKMSVDDVPGNKVPGKELKEKAKDRMDSLTKMLLSNSEDEE